jgi:hypothetical protein
MMCRTHHESGIGLHMEAWALGQSAMWACGQDRQTMLYALMVHSKLHY